MYQRTSVQRTRKCVMWRVHTFCGCTDVPSVTSMYISRTTKTTCVRIIMRTARFAVTLDTIQQGNHLRYTPYVSCFGLFNLLSFLLQTVYYFPLKTKLQSLLRVPKYKQMCQHEVLRPAKRNKNLMTDVYDSPAWQKFMGPSAYPNNRIGMYYIFLFRVPV